jgi:hypothetical protein
MPKGGLKMKTRMFIAVSILFLVAFVLVGQDSTKEITIDEAMAALCHTWTKPGGFGTNKDIYNHEGTYKWYYDVDATKPNYKGDFKIEEAWIDQEGNIRIIAWLDFRGGYKILYKLSNSETVLELNQYYGGTPPDKEATSFGYTYYRQE